MEKLEKVLVLNNEAQARLLESVLRQRKIPHLLRSYSDAAYDGLWQPQRGWGHIEAPKRFHEAVLEIYRDLTDKDTDPQ